MLGGGGGGIASRCVGSLCHRGSSCNHVGGGGGGGGNHSLLKTQFEQQVENIESKASN